MIEMTKPKKQTLKFKIWVGVVVVGILAAGSGFVFKLTEFIKVARNHDAESFALVPVAIYFAVTAGFICIFVWNYMRGGLENIERPKYDLMKRHEEIDRHDAAFTVRGARAKRPATGTQ